MVAKTIEQAQREHDARARAFATQQQQRPIDELLARVNRYARIMRMEYVLRPIGNDTYEIRYHRAGSYNRLLAIGSLKACEMFFKGVIHAQGDDE